MKQIGTQELETERLRLRRTHPKDAEQMFANWASDAEVTKYLTWSPHENVEETRELLAMWEGQYVQEDFYSWGLEEKATGKLIGMISVVHIDEELECAVIGYNLSRTYWNRGLMTEAVCAVNKYLLLRGAFDRVEAYHHVENPASGRVMQKSGMTYEGIRRHGAKDKHGIHCDVAVYAILKKDLQCAAPAL